MTLTQRYILRYLALLRTAQFIMMLLRHMYNTLELITMGFREKVNEQ